MSIEKKFEDQVNDGNRFEFGKNWDSFLQSLTEERIDVAVKSMRDMLEIDDLNGKTFLDIGCGSGLFSLCANKLNAEVHSLDFDPSSVGCARHLKTQYFPDKDWKIEEGSVLDKEFISSLGKFDVVYSWGVLHHTGNMELALSNALIPVKVGGKLFISIYNDEGWRSKSWLRVKKIYNSNFFGRMFILATYIPYFIFKGFLNDLAKFKNPIRRYSEYRLRRGMSIVHDWYDWLGGLPFEVAKPEEIFEFYKQRNCTLVKLTTQNNLGTNQFVFQRNE